MQLLIDSATYLFTISSPTLKSVAMSLYDITMSCDLAIGYNYIYQELGVASRNLHLQLNLHSLMTQLFSDNYHC